jgi:hypothetical protein
VGSSLRIAHFFGRNFYVYRTGISDRKSQGSYRTIAGKAWGADVSIKAVDVVTALHLCVLKKVIF